MVNQQHIIYLALGSNIGDRANNLSAALQQLCSIMTLHALSAVYETEPVGYLAQPRFFNLVCAGGTRLSPDELLHEAKKIEWQLGRRPAFRNAPRPIDIDILFYDNSSVESEQLTLPHPRWRERAFVLTPLAEIAPDFVDPVSGKSVRELLHTVPQDGIRKVGKLPDLTLNS